MVHAGLHVYVYGTLRAGESNDIAAAAAQHRRPAPHRLGPEAGLPGGLATLRGQLLDFGPYPGLLVDPAGAPVVGEVYEIAPTLLPVLDAIEEIQPGRVTLFQRSAARVDIGSGTLTCLFYPVTPALAGGRPVIADGDWVAHRLARSGLSGTR